LPPMHELAKILFQNIHPPESSTTLEEDFLLALFLGLLVLALKDKNLFADTLDYSFIRLEYLE
jgi:hypothetical protein